MADRLSSLLNVLNSNGNFIITSHETPDGDAIGSEMALYRALKQLGKNCLIFNADPMSHYYQFLDPEETIVVLEHERQLSIDPADWVLIMLDTNDINNIGQIRDIILPRVKSYIIIDHHQSENMEAENCILEEASSTCEILYDIFIQMGVRMTLDIANALYVGIVYDTGSFIYPKTTEKTFLIAYELVRAGVNPNFIYQKIYESNSISSLVLQSKVLATLELTFDRHVAIQTLRKEMIEECNASYEEAATFINMPLKSERIKVSIFFKENPEGVRRCSLRSKGNIDVAEIAQTFSGGGHKTAAGFKCRDSFEQTRANVLQMLEKYFT
jgi:bifunctional oligoribonuclease and PAP phosphatase NrnA